MRASLGFATTTRPRKPRGAWPIARKTEQKRLRSKAGLVFDRRRLDRLRLQLRDAVDGELDHDLGAGVVLDREIAGELAGEAVHQRAAEPARERGIALALPADAVVLDRKPDAVLAHGEDDVDDAAALAGKRVFRGVGDGLGDDEAERYGVARRKNQGIALAHDADARIVAADMRAAQLDAEILQELADIDVLDVVALEQVLVQHRERKHAPPRRVQRLARLVRAHAPGLEAEQARDHLKIVLHAVMDLGDERVAVRDHALQAPLALPDRARHLAELR